MAIIILTDDVYAVLTTLERKLKGMCVDGAHDVHHLRRTMELALRLQKKEGGDRFVIALASYLHDMHRVIQIETGKYCSPAESLPKVRELLVGAGVCSEEKIKHILLCIELHEEYDFSKQGKTAKDIEALILQDADNLDAMGAIGIARCFSYGGAHNIPIWMPEIPLDSESPWDESMSSSPSQIQHFHEKLLRLKDNINTETAKRMALRRHRFLQRFLKEFFMEWEGAV